MTEKQKEFDNICEEAMRLCGIDTLNAEQKDRYVYLCKRSEELFNEIMKERA